MANNMKIVSPSIKSTGFNCAHCGVLTTQFWSVVHGQRTKDNGVPLLPEQSTYDDIKSAADLDTEQKHDLLSYVEKMMAGDVFVAQKTQSIYVAQVNNLFVSQCYDCKKVTIWVHDRPVYPPLRSGPPPNIDLPDGTFKDYEEARAILDLSPRGAAALLRLCIQKICIYLGEKGKKIDDDIASLAAKGLHPVVKKSLDIVRVVGNDAVHPGTMDLNDDRDTALQLFSLVNAICEQMISLPKSVEDLYQKIPQAKRDAIDARDAKAATKITSEKKE
jgi:hypothetical protein